MRGHAGPRPAALPVTDVRGVALRPLLKAILAGPAAEKEPNRCSGGWSGRPRTSATQLPARTPPGVAQRGVTISILIDLMSALISIYWVLAADYRTRFRVRQKHVPGKLSKPSDLF